MFAVVRTGGKQYRVALGDKIVVEKVAGEAGQRIDITDVLLAGEGSELKSVKGLTVGAEIIAQAKGDKVTVFKKRRRHNYRRKQGHRQLHTILRIVAIGDHKAEKPVKAAPKTEPSSKADAGKSPAARAKETAEATADQHKAGEAAGKPTENPAPEKNAAANPPAQSADADAKPSGKKTAANAKAAKPASTKNAAPAKGAAKKSPKAK